MALYVREIKSTSEDISPGSSYWRRLILDPQGSLYLRPLLIGTGPILGLAPAPEYTFVIYASPVASYFKARAHLRLALAPRAQLRHLTSS